MRTKRKYYYTLKLAEANLVRSSNKCSKTFWHDPKESFLKARIVQLKLGESSGTHKNKQELINKLGKVIEKNQRLVEKQNSLTDSAMNEATGAAQDACQW